MYFLGLHSAVLRRKCKRRHSRESYIYSQSRRELHVFLHSLCVLLVVMNLVAITYNLTSSAQLLDKLQTENDVLQQRDNIIVSELRTRQSLPVARTRQYREMAGSEAREGESEGGEQEAWRPEFHRTSAHTFTKIQTNRRQVKTSSQ